MAKRSRLLFTACAALLLTACSTNSRTVVAELGRERGVNPSNEICVLQYDEPVDGSIVREVDRCDVLELRFLASPLNRVAPSLQSFQKPETGATDYYISVRANVNHNVIIRDAVATVDDRVFRMKPIRLRSNGDGQGGGFFIVNYKLPDDMVDALLASSKETAPKKVRLVFDRWLGRTKAIAFRVDDLRDLHRVTEFSRTHRNS